VDVVAHVVVLELGVEGAEVGVINVLEDKGRGFGLRVADDIEESDDVGTAGEVLQDLDLALDLLLLNGLEDFNDAFLVVDDVEAFEDFGVFTAACPESSQSALSLRFRRTNARYPAGCGLGAYLFCARPRNSPTRPS